LAWRAAYFIGVVALATAPAAGTTLQPPVERRTVWSGIYTPPQASRGEKIFEDHCEACHGADLRGNEGPALVGPAFMRNWTGLPLQELFAHIKVAMPEDAVASISDADKLDALAFILQKNSFPAGNRDLTTNAADLAEIMFEGKDGPEPPPTGSTVTATGCLTKAGTGWALTDASEPVRTTLEATRDPGVKPVPASPAANKTIRLLDVSAGDQREGQRVVVIGLMVRDQGNSGTADAINVLGVTALGTGCDR
jgi:hypothetical protein